MKIIMLGAPGAGKGTQAKKLAAKYSVPHVSTGDIFRANIKEGTELGRKAKEYMDKGALVPDNITIGMLIDRVHEEDCKKGFVLDGYPRTTAQAQSLDEVLKKLDESIDFALNIEVPDEIIVRRISGRRACPDCGASYHVEFSPSVKGNLCDHCNTELIIRDDDKPETVTKRLEVYNVLTKPLIEYYDNEGLLKSVDGTKSPEEVFESLIAIVGEV